MLELARGRLLEGETINLGGLHAQEGKEEVLPYWERNAYHHAVMNALPEETRALMARIFVVTPTASGRRSASSRPTSFPASG